MTRERDLAEVLRVSGAASSLDLLEQYIREVLETGELTEGAITEMKGYLDAAYQAFKDEVQKRDDGFHPSPELITLQPSGRKRFLFTCRICTHQWTRPAKREVDGSYTFKRFVKVGADTWRKSDLCPKCEIANIASPVYALDP